MRVRRWISLPLIVVCVMVAFDGERADGAAGGSGDNYRPQQTARCLEETEVGVSSGYSSAKVLHGYVWTLEVSFLFESGPHTVTASVFFTRTTTTAVRTRTSLVRDHTRRYRRAPQRWQYVLRRNVVIYWWTKPNRRQQLTLDGCLRKSL